MIKFILESAEEPKYLDSLFDFNINDYILPSAQIVEQKNKTGVQFSFKLNLQVEGSFEPSEKYAIIKDFNALIEPKWNLEEFVSKIPEWVSESWLHITPKKLQITTPINKFEKITEQKNLEKIPQIKRSQGYYIQIQPKKIEIIGWTMHGSYYGFLTLSQLAKIHENNLYFPECEILDFPDLEYRGLEDDISRGQRPHMKHLKEFIHYLSRLKLNVSGLYIEDMYKFEKYPTIGSGRNPLTKEEIHEIEDYAREQFVDIQPAVEMFGHMDNMLTLPEFRKFGEFPGAQCLDISSQETRQLVDDLLKELCSAFRSDVFHLICDESFDFGIYNSRNYIKKLGKGKALAEWYLFLTDIIKKYGKKLPGFAHDIIIHHPKAMKLVKGKIPLILFWNYSNKKHYPTISKLKNRGFEVACVPSTFDWSRHYPYSEYAEKNTIYMGKEALKRGSKIMITTKFGDFFNENFRENIRYGLAIESQAAWKNSSELLWDIRGNLDCTKLKIAFIQQFFDTKDQRILECMNLLIQQNRVLPSFPNGMMNRYWMDPYCREISKKEHEYQKRFIKEAVYILETIKKLREEKVIKKNIDHLDYIEFAARMTLHFGVKILSAEAAWKKKYELLKDLPIILTKLMNENIIPKVNIPQEKASQYKDLVPYFEWLLADINQQKLTYQDLWLRLAVPEGLEYPFHRMEVLGWYYENSIKDLSTNQKPADNQLKSEWIWRNGRRWKWNWGNRVPNYFYKIINVSKPLKHAIIQGIADNAMYIFLNGQHIGDVFSRNSLSQLPIAKSVQWFDITDKIKINDRNLLSVEGWNYAHGLGSFNLLIHLEYNDGTSQDIPTDVSWNYTENKPQTWPLKEIGDIKDSDNWRQPRSLGRPPLARNGPISKPNWEKGWKSEVSFIFGLRNSIETNVCSFVGENVLKIFFWLVPFGARLFKTDIYNYRKL